LFNSFTDGDPRDDPRGYLKFLFEMDDLANVKATLLSDIQHLVGEEGRWEQAIRSVTEHSWPDLVEAIVKAVRQPEGE